MLLLAASGAGLTPIVRALLRALQSSRDVKVEYVMVRTAEQESLLHLAARGNHWEVMDLLIDSTPLQLKGQGAVDAEGVLPLERCGNRAMREHFEHRRLDSVEVFGAFVSHCKADAAIDARYLKEQLEPILGKRVAATAHGRWRHWGGTTLKPL